MLVIKRIYEPYEPTDGYRVLVDRLWPRGVSKERAHLNLWLKEIAPTTELREWYGHDPAKFTEFTKKYIAEIKQNPALQELLTIIKDNPTVTLLYGAKTPDNEAAVLLKYIQSL